MKKKKQRPEHLAVASNNQQERLAKLARTTSAHQWREQKDYGVTDYREREMLMKEGVIGIRVPKYKLVGKKWQRLLGKDYSF